jgi:hypothetical protein
MTQNDRLGLGRILHSVLRTEAGESDHVDPMFSKKF